MMRGFLADNYYFIILDVHVDVYLSGYVAYFKVHSQGACYTFRVYLTSGVTWIDGKRYFYNNARKLLVPSGCCRKKSLACPADTLCKKWQNYIIEKRGDVYDL